MVGLVDRLASPSEGLSSDPNAANEGKGLEVRSEVESVAYLVVGASQALEDGVDGYLIPGDGLLPWGRRGTSNRATSGHYLLVRMH